jgi:hypothetical protein
VVTPVIHAVELEFSVGVTATLSAGDVDLPDGVALGEFSATLTPALGDPSEGVEFTESDGVFRAAFKYLIPGDGPFEVVLNAPDGWTVEVSPESPQEDINPASGQTATIDWTLQKHPGERRLSHRTDSRGPRVAPRLRKRPRDAAGAFLIGG